MGWRSRRVGGTTRTYMIGARMVSLREMIVAKITKTKWAFAVNKIANHATNNTCDQRLVDRMAAMRTRVLHGVAVKSLSRMVA